MKPYLKYYSYRKQCTEDFDKAGVSYRLFCRVQAKLAHRHSGVPGHGKSTFIESAGQMLCHQG